MSTLKNIDWIQYLKRDNTVFYVTIYHESQGNLLLKTNGFCFEHQLCWHDGKFAFYFCAKEDMPRILHSFLQLMRKRSPQLEQWYREGIKHQEKEKQLIKQFSGLLSSTWIKEHYDELKEELEHLFLYLTTIPYAVLEAVQNAPVEERKEFQQYVKLFQPFRKVSRVGLHELVLEKIWKAAADMAGWDNFMDFSYFTTTELGELFKGKPYPSCEEIERRKNGCFFYKGKDMGNETFYYDKDFFKGVGISSLTAAAGDVAGDVAEIKGIVACRGFVRGKVCVVNRVGDMHKFKDGDIVVSINSNPSLMPALSKCKALVTDDGGLSSHAAIIARELNIPCVIGTKNATHVFKDGDVVCVDATAGVVKRVTLAWVSEFIDSVLATLGCMDIGTLQPYDFLQFEPLFAKEFVAKVDELIQAARRKNITSHELAQLWSTSAGLRIPLLFLLLQMKSAKVLREKRIELAQFFFDMLQARVVSDTHGRFSNICQTKEQIDTLLQKHSFVTGTPEAAKVLGKMYNALYNLCSGLYMDIYLDYCAENEGSYDVSHVYGPGHVLVIKQFVNMQTEVWSEISVPCNDLVMYCVYKDVKFTCDMASVHSVYQGDVINGLVDYTVVVDGNVVNDVGQLKMLLDQFSLLSVEQWQRLKNLPEHEQRLKGLHIKLYGMKKLFDRVGMDWKPTEQMKEAVKAPLKDNSYWKIPKDPVDAAIYWRKMYDPEEEFYPGDSLS